MTEFVIELLRLRGDEPWADWGARWHDHAEILGELPQEELGGWRLIDHFRNEGVRGTQLDWGALLYPILKRDLISLYSDEATLRRLDSDSRQVRLALAELPDDDDYGLVVIECS